MVMFKLKLFTDICSCSLVSCMDSNNHLQPRGISSESFPSFEEENEELKGQGNHPLHSTNENCFCL